MDEHWAPDHIVLARRVLTHAGRLLVERDATGAVVLVLAGILAFLRLNRIRRARLTSGGSLAAGMAVVAVPPHFHPPSQDLLDETTVLETLDELTHELVEGLIDG